MKKQQFLKEINRIMFQNYSGASWQMYSKRKINVESIINKFETRISGKKGAEYARERFFKSVSQINKRQEFEFNPAHTLRYSSKKEYQSCARSFRLSKWKKQQAERLAKLAGQYYDEHGYKRGDYLNTTGIDFVPSWDSSKTPYLDMGGEGLALITISRMRVYAKSYGYGPGYAETRYLIGKNETGTYFAHSVPKTINTVKEAISWIWSGLESTIIVRQGDIALVFGKGPKNLNKLPKGHKVEDDSIIHDQHPTIPVPGVGQRIIIGRRASVQVSEATRD